MELPRRVQVTGVITSRYRPGFRPISWDERFPGIERVKTESGEEITLYSTGGQSSPAPGWILLLTKPAETGELQEIETYAASRKPLAGAVGSPMQEGQNNAICWTLYGIAKSDAPQPPA